MQQHCALCLQSLTHANVSDAVLRCAHLCCLCLQHASPAALVLQVAADAALVLLLHALLAADHCLQALQLLL